MSLEPPGIEWIGAEGCRFLSTDNGLDIIDENSDPHSRVCVLGEDLDRLRRFIEEIHEPRMRKLETNG